jgi:hypothetical protein
MNHRCEGSIMPDRVPIRYREFWDVPRVFLVSHRGQLFLFDCPFDEAAEDFPDCYRVYVLPPVAEEDLTGSWDKLSARAISFLGEVPIKQVGFDPSKRQTIDTTLLDELLTRKTGPVVPAAR